MRPRISFEAFAAFSSNFVLPGRSSFACTEDGKSIEKGAETGGARRFFSRQSVPE
ncbi:hypothetical protein SLG_11730 [Sphingobium sp. SYK-6]|nr:hypothetical protein SLG_11730 [Sphingobium sp. SYK-6]